MTDVPLGGQRNFAYLARLSPGVVPAEPGARDAAGGGFSANGVRSNGQNNFLLNGVDNNVNVIDFLNQTAYVVGPSVEAIGEMTRSHQRLQRRVRPRRRRRGQREVQVRHQRIARQRFRDSCRTTTSTRTLWENNQAGAAARAFRQNQFGATAAGRSSRTSCSCSATTRARGSPLPAAPCRPRLCAASCTIPTPAMVERRFFAIADGQSDRHGRSGPSHLRRVRSTIRSRPRTVNGQLGVADPFPGNIIPTSRFDPPAAKIMELFPQAEHQLPNATGGFPPNDYFIRHAGRAKHRSGRRPRGLPS